MADSASTLEVQQRRAFEASTFAQQQAQEAYAQRQAASLGTGLDSLPSRTVADTPGVNVAPQNADQARAAEVQKGLGPIARLQQVQKLRQQAAASVASGGAAAAANQAYARVFNTFQSELIANAMALEVVISPWLFLGLYFMRIIGGFFPITVKGIRVIPPYTLRGGGFAVAVMHSTAALVILALVFALLFLVMFIVWVISEGPITQAKIFLDLVGGPFGAIQAFFGGGSSGGAGATGNF